MIEQIRIKDFQSIEELTIDCGPITVIHGESDTGKSAVVRALYALAHNSYPKGHVREGAKQSYVSVVTGSAPYVVSAEKGEGVNGYRLTSPDPSESMEWGRVGKDVPPEITNLLGWHEVELDDGTRFTPNFHRQFDPPFLLTDSPSKVAKVLGSLTNIAVLFAAIKAANGRERKATTQASAYADMRDDTLSKVSGLEEGVSVRQKAYDELQGVLTQARQTALIANKATGFMLQALEISESHSLSMNILEMCDRSDPEGLERIEELIPRLQGLQAQLDNIENEQAWVNSYRSEVAKADAELAEIEAQLEEFDVCPICGSEMGE